MTLYDARQHETLLVAWHYQLQTNPVEHVNLFMEPLRNLTNLLAWAKDQVKLMVSWDAKGLWGAAWVEPVMSGAFFGLWIRYDMRGTPAAVAFVNRCYDQSLEHFPVLIGITKQERLHAIHLRMGYLYLGIIERLFDGDPARVYVMTKESRYGRRRQNINLKEQQPLRADAGGVRASGPATVPAVRKPGGGSPSNGRRKRASTHRGKKRGRSKVSAQLVNGADPAGAGAERAG